MADYYNTTIPTASSVNTPYQTTGPAYTSSTADSSVRASYPTDASVHTSNPTASSVNSSSPATSSTDTTAAKLNASLQSTKDSVLSTAQSTMNSIQNSSAVQSLSNGPVVENVRNQASLTSSEFQNLANARTRPGQAAATGQELTQYHSMFYSLLSWENPRATAVSFAVSVVFIFMTRFLNILHYAFKFAYFVLGVTASLEIAGKLLFDDGLASKMRPRKYWTIPRRSLEASLDDVEQIINFFVIETQRIVYAENVYATIAVFLAALMSYGLIKIVPVWGLALMGTCVMYLAPLIYVKNREVIDNQVEHVTDIIGTQASQLRDLTAHHANQATETVKNYTQEYTHKAQEYMGSTNNSVNHPTTRSEDFPVAPKQEFSAHAQEFPVAPKQEPASNVLKYTHTESTAPSMPSAATPEPPHF